MKDASDGTRTHNTRFVAEGETWPSPELTIHYTNISEMLDGTRTRNPHKFYR